MKNKINRRKAIKNMALGAGMVTVGSGLATAKANASEIKSNIMKDTFPLLKGNINHSVCRWCYNQIPLEELADRAKDIGIKSIEIIGPADWPVVQKKGLTCALGNGPFVSLTKGFNDRKNHPNLIEPYKNLIDQAADAGLETLICFSGNRNGISEEEGLENCAVGLDAVAKHAEKRNIMLVMELLNSKVNHPDYQCDKSPWGIKLVDKVGSDNFKLLYDIYHMQIMEGDVIATIQKYHNYFAHYHTGGVPGRNEINETQELYYPAIMKAILDTGYTGYVAQEFIPKGPHPIASLAEGVLICDV